MARHRTGNPRERRHGVPDRPDHPLVDVRTDHVQPLAGELHGERQADLAQPDHRDLRHRRPGPGRGHDGIRMLSPVAA